MIVHACENLEQGHHSIIAGGSANLHSNYEIHIVFPQKSWEFIYLKIQLYYSWAYNKCPILPQGHLLNYVHNDFNHNGKK